MDNRIVIDCDKRIELDNYMYVNTIESLINDYQQDDSLVTGNILIKVNYYDKENLMKEKEEFIPFNVTLLNNNSINKLDVINFNYYDIVGVGLQCSFQLDIILKEKNKDEEKEDDELEMNEETQEQYEEKIKEIYQEKLDEIFDFDNNVSMEESVIIEDSDGFKEIVEEFQEEQIDDYFDDIFQEVKEKILNINNFDDNRLSLKNIKESYGTYRVYYPKEENEIDKVCVSENISVSNIYNKDFNKEFSKKKRIIIEK